MPSPVINRRTNGMQSVLSPGAIAAIADWTSRITPFVQPSTLVKYYHGVFWDDLNRAGIVSGMMAVNTFPTSTGDNNTVLRPFIRNKGNAAWGTVTGDFTGFSWTSAGLACGGASNGLKTGIVGTDFPSDASVGISIYCSSVTNGAGNYNVGYTNNAGSDMITLAQARTPTALFGCFNNSTSSINPATQAAGFFSGNRISSVSANVYYAKSTSPFASIGSLASSAGSRSNHELYTHCVFAYEGPVATGFVADRMSMVAIHSGLTAGGAQALFNAIQKLRINLGGGFV